MVFSPRFQTKMRQSRTIIWLADLICSAYDIFSFSEEKKSMEERERERREKSLNWKKVRFREIKILEMWKWAWRTPFPVQKIGFSLWSNLDAVLMKYVRWGQNDVNDLGLTVHYGDDLGLGCPDIIDPEKVYFSIGPCSTERIIEAFDSIIFDSIYKHITKWNKRKIWRIGKWLCRPMCKCTRPRDGAKDK